VQTAPTGPELAGPGTTAATPLPPLPQPASKAVINTVINQACGWIVLFDLFMKYSPYNGYSQNEISKADCP
jgi:hypothetical protein